MPVRTKALYLALAASWALTIWSWGVCIAALNYTSSKPAAHQHGGIYADPGYNRDQSPLLVATQGAPAGQIGTDNSGEQKEGNLAEKRMVWLTLALLVVATFQAVFFVWQLCYMKDALKHTALNARGAIKAALAARSSTQVATDTAKKQLRAYVAIEIAKFDAIEPDKPITFRFRAVNHGPTPARQFAFRGYTATIPIEAFHQTTPAPPNDRDHRWNDERMDVCPSRASGPEQLVTSMTGFIRPKVVYDAIDSGSLALIHFLQIRYVDAFNQEQFTQVCYRILRRIDAAEGTIDITCETVPRTSRMT